MSKENHSDTIEQTFRAIAAEVFDERLAKVETHQPKTDGTSVDDATQQQINTYELISRKPYLTRKEAAIYLDVSERSIVEWSSLPPDKNPFPETYAGGIPRYKREEIDKWMRGRGRVHLKAVS